MRWAAIWPRATSSPPRCRPMCCLVSCRAEGLDRRRRSNRRRRALTPVSIRPLPLLVLEESPQVGYPHLPLLLTLLGADLAFVPLPLQIVLRQLHQEAARLRSYRLAKLAPLLAQDEGQLGLSPGDAHIGQPPLLVDVILVDADLVRQQPLLHANQEHVGELQPLGGV